MKDTTNEETQCRLRAQVEELRKAIEHENRTSSELRFQLQRMQEINQRNSDELNSKHASKIDALAEANALLREEADELTRKLQEARDAEISSISRHRDEEKGLLEPNISDLNARLEASTALLEQKEDTHREKLGLLEKEYQSRIEADTV